MRSNQPGQKRHGSGLPIDRLATYLTLFGVPALSVTLASCSLLAESQPERHNYVAKERRAPKLNPESAQTSPGANPDAASGALKAASGSAAAPRPDASMAKASRPTQSMKQPQAGGGPSPGGRAGLSAMPEVGPSPLYYYQQQGKQPAANAPADQTVSQQQAPEVRAPAPGKKSAKQTAASSASEASEASGTQEAPTSAPARERAAAPKPVPKASKDASAEASREPKAIAGNKMSENKMSELPEPVATFPDLSDVPERSPQQRQQYTRTRERAARFMARYQPSPDYGDSQYLPDAEARTMPTPTPEPSSEQAKSGEEPDEAVKFEEPAKQPAPESRQAAISPWQPAPESRQAMGAPAPGTAPAPAPAPTPSIWSQQPLPPLKQPPGATETKEAETPPRSRPGYDTQAPATNQEAAPRTLAIPRRPAAPSPAATDAPDMPPRRRNRGPGTPGATPPIRLSSPVPYEQRRGMIGPSRYQRLRHR